MFTELDPILDAMVGNAPEQVADAAATFVSTARATVKSGDFTPFGFALADAAIELGACHGGLAALLDGHLGTAERDRQGFVFAQRRQTAFPQGPIQRIHPTGRQGASPAQDGL